MSTLRSVDMTPAEQVTLRTYPALAIVAGILYIFQADSRLSGPAFDVARNCWPMDVWGVIFLVIGLVQAAVLACGGRDGSRRAYLLTLRAGVGLTAFWTVLLVSSAQQSPFVSYTGAVWLAGITVLQLASTRGLANPRPPRA